jgi:hypothetical protein
MDVREAKLLLNALDAGGQRAARTCLIPERARPVLEDALHVDPETLDRRTYRAGLLPWGAGVGTAIVGEPRLGGDIGASFGVEFPNDSDRNEHANFGWPMLDVERWFPAVPARGRQGLWNWTEAQGEALPLEGAQ